MVTQEHQIDSHSVLVILLMEAYSKVSKDLDHQMADPSLSKNGRTSRPFGP